MFEFLLVITAVVSCFVCYRMGWRDGHAYGAFWAERK